MVERVFFVKFRPSTKSKQIETN